MTFVPVPHVVDEQLIQTIWGNTVADDLTYLNSAIGKVPVTTYAGKDRPTNAAWGQLGYAQTTAAQSGIGTAETDLTGLSITITPPANRRLQVMGNVRLFTSSTGIIGIRINIGGSTVQEFTFAAANNGFLMTNPHVLVNSTGAAMTFKLRGVITAGTFNVDASATGPGFVIVNDLGPV